MAEHQAVALFIDLHELEGEWKSATEIFLGLSVLMWLPGK